VANTANKPGPGEMAYTKVAKAKESSVSKSICYNFQYYYYEF